MPSEKQPSERGRYESRRIAENPDHYLKRAADIFVKGEYDQACFLYERALELETNSIKKARILLELMALLIWDGDFQRAEHRASELTRLLAEAPSTNEVKFTRGMMNAELAQIELDQEQMKVRATDALSDLEDLMSNVDADTVARTFVTAARLNNLLGKPAKAIEICAECLQMRLKTHERYDCLHEMIQGLYSLGDYARALALISDNLISDESDDEKVPWIYYLQGLIKLEVDDMSAAQCSFEMSAAVLNRKTRKNYHDNILLANIYTELAKLHSENGDIDESICLLQDTLTFVPEDSVQERTVFALLGQSYHLKGRNTKAVELYTRVLDSQKASPVEKGLVYQGLGKVYFDLTQYQSAVDAFEKAAQIFSWEQEFYGDLLLWLGDSWHAVHDDQRARKCYVDIIESPRALPRHKDLARRYLNLLPVPLFH